MKEKETRIGTFRIVHNDTGLTLYPQSGKEDTGVWYTLFPPAIEELKMFLTSNEKREISYLDRTYMDKRRILRQLSIKDEIRNYLHIITDKIWEKVLGTPSFDFIEDIELYHYIKNLLIDGFIAFEIIFDDKQKSIIDLQPIDPCSLTPVFRSSVGESKGDFDWIQYPDNEKLKRILLKSQIIYISYSSGNEYSPTSYVEELKESYEKMKRIENELVASRINLPGDMYKNMNKKVTFKELERADKKLQFMSKIPKSILKEEKTFSDDVRYNKFIQRISQIFDTELIGKLIETKNNL